MQFSWLCNAIMVCVDPDAQMGIDEVTRVYDSVSIAAVCWQVKRGQVRKARAVCGGSEELPIAMHKSIGGWQNDIASSNFGRDSHNVAALIGARRSAPSRGHS